MRGILNQTSTGSDLPEESGTMVAVFTDIIKKIKNGPEGICGWLG